MTITSPAGTRVYARTFSATSKHVENPDKPGRTLCGHDIVLYGRDLLRRDRWMVYDLGTCGRCERSATRRELTEGPEVFRPDAERVIRYINRRSGLVCMEDVDYSAPGALITLCGLGANEQRRTDDTGGLPICPDCQHKATAENYAPHGTDTVAQQAIRDAARTATPDPSS